jgi:hypothetical protein
MQRGLVGDGAVDDRDAVARVGEAQPVEPGGPPGIEVPLEADLVSSGLAAVAVDACSSDLSVDAAGFAVVAGVIQKLEADVMSAHHHTW